MALDMTRPWRRVGSRSLVKDKWIDLRAESWVTGLGIELDPWYMLHWRPWVHVVAITPDEQVVMVRQFRPGANAAMLEMPGGVVDEDGEGEVRLAAERELLEETGYTADGFTEYASPFNDPAHATNRVHFFFALNARRVAEQSLDLAEDITVELVPIADLIAGLPRGLVAHASHIGTLYLGLIAAGRIAVTLKSQK
jgi:8-oxo-dGTP pyrophosphatase MutT (NUDIX family)